MSELDGLLRRDLMWISEFNRRNNYRDLLDRANRYGPEMSYPALMLLDRLYTEREREPRDGTRGSWSSALAQLTRLGFAAPMVDAAQELWGEITPMGREWFKL